MKGMKLLCPLLLAVFLATPALAEKPNLRHGFSMSLSPGRVQGDTSGDVDFMGLALALKAGFTRHWGLQLLGRASVDTQSSSIDEESEFQQIAVSAVYMLRPMKEFRPHIRLGGAWSRIKTDIPGVINTADTEILPMAGGGFEWGSRKTAFFAEVDYVTGEYFQDTSFADDKTIVNVSLGVIFKFYKD
jgi:hypothetical protein